MPGSMGIGTNAAWGTLYIDACCETYADLFIIAAGCEATSGKLLDVQLGEKLDVQLGEKLGEKLGGQEIGQLELSNDTLVSQSCFKAIEEDLVDLVDKAVPEELSTTKDNLPLQCGESIAAESIGSHSSCSVDNSCSFLLEESMFADKEDI
jgi:hypothetical protein